MASTTSNTSTVSNSALKNVKIIVFQPVVGPNGVVQDKMSLNTLLEAAKFLELQEQRQQHRATLESALATAATVRPVAAVNGTAQLQNGTGGATQTITLQPLKVISTTATSINNLTNHKAQPQPTQTVVISSNNISSTILHSVQGPITFTAPPPTTSAPSITPQAPVVRQEQDGHISSTTLPPGQRHRILNNSFDIMNPLIIDESTPLDHKKLKQPPMVFRSGTREVHNKLEKHRRAHLKECFDILKKQLPSNGEEKKTSNLSILHSALRYIQTLKRRERDLEHEMERLAREKIGHQQRLAILKKDISSHYDNVDFAKLLPDIAPQPLPHNPSGNEVSTSSSVVSTMNSIASVSSSDLSKSEGCTMISSTSVNMGISTATVIGHSTAPSTVIAANGENKISIPILSKAVPLATSQAPSMTSIKEVTQPVQTTGISVLPMTYPVNQGLVLQKVAIVPHKGLTDLAPLVSTHFITTPQQLNGINGQLNGKVVPLTQYLVKPVVVVSTASPRPGS